LIILIAAVAGGLLAYAFLNRRRGTPIGGVPTSTPPATPGSTTRIPPPVAPESPTTQEPPIIDAPTTPEPPLPGADEPTVVTPPPTDAPGPDEPPRP
jgi:hypothetical protein